VPEVEASGSNLKTPSSFLFAPSTVGEIRILARFLEVKAVQPTLYGVVDRVITVHD